MKELENRRKIRRLMYSTPSLVLILILTLLFFKGAWGIMSKERESASRTEELEEKMLALAGREIELKNEISELTTTDGIKDEIRARYGMTQEDEHLAIIVDEKTATTTREETDRAWYKRFWDAIIGND